MIISHKYRFLFIGLPFSASSAITKELYKEYEGKPILRKHSLYQEFLKIANDKEKKYFVFAVLRNPLEIAVTVYEKMKSNAKGNFTNPTLFTAIQVRYLLLISIFWKHEMGICTHQKESTVSNRTVKKTGTILGTGR